MKNRQLKILKIIKTILSYLLATIVALFLVGGGFWLYDEVYTQIPPIEATKISERPQTTKITDRNGVVLFKVYDENREYMPMNLINSHMINAIVSIEDEHFRKHPGINIRSILRAAKDNLLTDKPLQGGSTIDQQLVRNLFLTNEKTIKRKLKEAILTLRFHNYIKNNYSSSTHKLSKKEVKNKILELYLNYIPFGNNTFGVQTAAKRYFNTDAKDLTILESSILASLPKATSLYNPYTNRDRLMGKLTITKVSNEKTEKEDNKEINIELRKILIDSIKDTIKKSSWEKGANWETNLGNITNTLPNKIKHKDATYTLTYIPGRKDIVLSKMLELQKITQQEYKQAFADGLDIQFHNGKNYIKSPHFVFYIMQILNQERGEEIIKKGGLVVKTTLDIGKQQQIIEAIQDNTETLEKYGANNSANITINTQNGDIINYIGSKDFWSQEIEGQNDILQAQRQLGSILKPLFYAKAFDDLYLGPNTIIPDTPIKIGNHIPRNYDNRFAGNIPIKTALPHSRNIPAIKIFYDLGGEAFGKKFFKQLGIGSMDETQTYGHNIVLGGVEMTVFELVKAYRHLSNPNPAKINPILEIRDKNNTILYKKQQERETSIFTPQTIEEIRKILSTPQNFEKRVKYRLNKYGISFAVKSGTSGIKLKNGEDRSKDGVVVGYNETFITALRAGNTDGSPMHADAYGFFLNKDILNEIHKIIKQ